MSNISLYWAKGNNFGDELSKYLLEKITKCKAEYKYPEWLSFPNSAPVIVSIGSLLNNYIIHTNSVVWGSGILDRKYMVLR